MSGIGEREHDARTRGRDRDAREDRACRLKRVRPVRTVAGATTLEIGRRPIRGDARDDGTAGAETTDAQSDEGWQADAEQARLLLHDGSRYGFDVRLRNRSGGGLWRRLFRIWSDAHLRSRIERPRYIHARRRVRRRGGGR
jgi:hypothetical protein